MRPDQIPLLNSVSAPSVHPTEPWCVVSVTHPDFASDSYPGQLWRVPFDGAPRRLTRGFCDRAPQFSPDGQLLAFIRSAPGDKPQLFVVESSGGEPVRLTDQHLGVGSFAWAPDGQSLAYTARVAQDGRYGTLDGVGAGAEDPRHFDGVRLQMNGVGWSEDRRPQLFVVELPDLGAEPVITPVGRAAKEAGDDAPALVPASRRLTDDEFAWSNPEFAADGTSLYAIAARHDGRDLDLVTDVWAVPLDGGEPRQLNVQGETRLGAHDLVRSGDGRTLFVVMSELGSSGRDFVGQYPGVFAIPAAGGEPRRLTGKDVDVAGVARRGEAGCLVLDNVRGATRVVALDAAGALTEVLGGPVVAQAAAEVRGSDDVVVVRATATSTGDVVLVHGGAERTLTDFSATLRAETTIREPQELTVAAADGYPVHGWVVTPDGDGPFPTLLLIHGGPFSHYTPAFFDEVQTYVAAGYGVVLCNPRGSSSYGEEHGKAIQGDFGNLDFGDVISFLEGALDAHPELDRERLGVMGGSYGGYLTAWVIGHDHRFRGAIVERGFLDPASFVGASDIGWFFTHEYNTADAEVMNRQSPMLVTDQVTTPTLVLHSEQDLRCPLGQALRYYTQLKLAGVESELLVFPGENHELSRSGTPWHRKQRFDAILEWWSRHLG